MHIQSKLFSFDGFPSYLEGTGEPDAIGYMTFSLITWIGKLSKDDPPGDYGWFHGHGVVLSGGMLSLYSDVTAMGDEPTLYSEITLDYEDSKKIWLEWGLKSVEDIVRHLARDPITKVRHLDHTGDWVDDFGKTKWVEKMGCYTAEDLQ